jgi:hypothetical protein
MRIWAVIPILFLISIVSAGSESYVSIDAYVGGGGGIISKHTTHSSVGNGIDTNYNSLTAGSHVLTGPGNNQYREKTKLDAATGNLYDSSSELIADSGYIYDDTSSMTDKQIAIPELEGGGTGDNATQPGQTPSYQSVETHADGMGDYVTYTADKVIDDANMTTDYIAEGGSGVYDVKTSAVIEAGMSKNSGNTDDYTARVSDRKTAFGNSTSMLQGKVSLKYRSFARPMGFGDANSYITVDETGALLGST